jgi:hypothetical protein
MALMFASRIQNESIPIVIGWVLSAGQVPYFAIPNRLIQYTLGFSWALGFPLSSHFSHLDGKGDLAAMREAWFTTTRFLQFVLFGATVAVLAMGEPFLLRWMGPSTDPALPSIAEGGKWVIRLVGASLLVEGLAPNASRLLVAMNRHGFVARLFLTIALVSFPITVALAFSTSGRSPCCWPAQVARCYSLSPSRRSSRTSATRFPFCPAGGGWPARSWRCVWRRPPTIHDLANRCWPQLSRGARVLRDPLRRNRLLRLARFPRLRPTEGRRKGS